MSKIEIKPKVIFACTGLGHVNRGAESHIRECFEVLKGNEKFEIVLLKGAGPSDRCEKRIFCFKRSDKINLWISKVFKLGNVQCEHISFFICSIPQILFLNPKLIYTPNYNLARYYYHFRNLFQLNFKIVLIQTGIEMNAIDKLDFVHQLLYENKKKLIASGFKDENQFVVPHGFYSENYVKHDNIINLKEKFGLPSDKFIILSVGIINKSEKRFDYLITEIAKCNNKNLFLFGVGDFDNESKEIIDLANKSLGVENFKFMSSKFNEMPEIYKCADLVCQPSLREGFGKVYVESLLSERPLICHDFAVTREVLGNHAIFKDLSKDGELVMLLENVEKIILDVNPRSRRFFAIAKYEWVKLREKYINMFLYFSVK